MTELIGISTLNIVLDEDYMSKGAMAENYVATELLKNDLSLYYYQEPQVMEMDFLLNTGDGVIPVLWY